MSRQSGFSLLELVIVVCIVGVLAAVAIPNYLSMQEMARESVVKGNAHAVQLYVEDWAAAHNGMVPKAVPSDLNSADKPVNPFGGLALANGHFPFIRGVVTYEVGDRWGTYTITAYGKNADSGPNKDGVILTLTNQ